MKVYSFANTVMLINGVEVTGWAEGDDVIQVKRLSDSASHKIGADGKMVVSLSTNKSGEFTFKLMQTSPTNAYLCGLMALQENADGNLFIPINCLFQDTLRQDLATGTVGYLKRPADMSRGAQAQTQEWTVVTERLDFLFGAD